MDMGRPQCGQCRPRATSPLLHINREWGCGQINKKVKKNAEKYERVGFTSALWGLRAECHAEARHSNSHPGQWIVWEEARSSQHAR